MHLLKFISHSSISPYSEKTKMQTALTRLIRAVAMGKTRAGKREKRVPGWPRLERRELQPWWVESMCRTRRVHWFLPGSVVFCRARGGVSPLVLAEPAVWPAGSAVLLSGRVCPRHPVGQPARTRTHIARWWRSATVVHPDLTHPASSLAGVASVAVSPGTIRMACDGGQSNRVPDARIHPDPAHE